MPALPIRCCRVAALVLVSGSVLSAVAIAGKLSAARKAVRENNSEESQRDEDEDEHHGKLNKVRRAVRRDNRPRRRRDGRPARRHFRLHPQFIVALDADGDSCPPVVPRPLVVPAAKEADPAPDEACLPPLPPPPKRPVCRFPYSDGYLIGPSWVHAGRNWAGRFRLERGFKTDGVDRWGFAFLVEEGNGLGLQSEWNRYTERLPGGRRDRLHFGDLNLVFRAVETEYGHARFGLGLNWLDDRVRLDLGWNFTAGIDFFPRRPWIVSGELDLGNVGDAFLFHGRLTAGAAWNRFEIFGGYDFRSLDSVSLHGPLVGFRIWF